MKTINFIDPSDLAQLDFEVEQMPRGAARAEKRRELNVLIQERLELDRDLRAIYHRGGDVLALSKIVSGWVDNDQCDCAAGWHVEYSIVKVEPIHATDMDKLATALEKVYSTEGSCGCSHDCCGCVRWYADATLIGNDGDKSLTFALRQVATSNI